MSKHTFVAIESTHYFRKADLIFLEELKRATKHFNIHHQQMFAQVDENNFIDWVELERLYVSDLMMKRNGRQLAQLLTSFSRFSLSRGTDFMLASLRDNDLCFDYTAIFEFLTDSDETHHLVEIVETQLNREPRIAETEAFRKLQKTFPNELSEGVVAELVSGVRL